MAIVIIGVIIFMKNIVILDGYTTSPENNLWEDIKSLGSLTIYDRTNANDTVSRASDAEFILTNKTIIDDSVMASLPNLKYVGLLSTGTNTADLDAAKKRGIVVTNIPAYSTDSVAQMIFSFILNMSFKINIHNDKVHSGEWENSIDFSFYDKNITEIKGKTLGIIGFGSIGKRVASIANIFGSNIIVHTRTQKDKPGYENFSWVSKETVFRDSDYLCLTCPLTEETKEIVNKESLSLMKKSACLINTSRGGCINEVDLAYALDNDIISFASLDVLSTEPPKKDNPLLKAKNCIITPHIAWATKEARERLAKIAYENIKYFMDGKPQNVVNI